MHHTQESSPNVFVYWQHLVFKILPTTIPLALNSLLNPSTQTLAHFTSLIRSLLQIRLPVVCNIHLQLAYLSHGGLVNALSGFLWVGGWNGMGVGHRPGLHSNVMNI